MSGQEARSAASPLREQGYYLFRLGCGCRASWPSWQLVHRCKKHPNGPVPVRTTMRLV